MAAVIGGIGRIVGSLGRVALNSARLGARSRKRIGLGSGNTFITKTISSEVRRIQAQNKAERERLNEDIVVEIVGNTRKQLEIDDINFTGGLSGSVHTGYGENEMRTVEIDSPYAIPVEFGVLPGKRLNLDGLKKWVEGKLGVYDPKERDVIAYKIQNKIKSKGIRPTRFFKKAIKALIAKRGVIKSSGSRRNISRFERVLNKGIKASRKINRASKRISKYISTANRVMRVTK